MPLLECLLLVLCFSLVFGDTSLVLNLVIKFLESLQVFCLVSLALFFELKVSSDPALVLLVLLDTFGAAVTLSFAEYLGLMLSRADPLDQFIALGLGVVSDTVATRLASVFSTFESGEAVS